MLNVHYSNDIDHLVRQLALALGSGAQVPPDPFSVRTVIVPNANVETYLKFEIARRTGIFAGVRFLFLERFLADLLSQAGEKRRLLDRKTLQHLLVTLFLDPEAARKLPGAVRDYLGPVGQPAGARALRTFQLADHLSRLYEEYALSRPGMLERWSAGKAAFDGGPFRAAEAWQRAVWTLLFGQDGVLGRIAGKGTQFLLAKDQAGVIKTGRLDLPPLVHLFGFSYVSRSHNRIIEELSRRTDVAVYALNPCREFWEDVLTLPEAARIRQGYLERSSRLGEAAVEAGEDPFHLGDAEGATLLGLWGRPGRENIRLLNEMTECEFHSGFRDPLEGGYSLLRRLQQDILNREAQRTEPPAAYRPGEDRSLRVLECPDIRREVEIIAGEIWELVREDGDADRATGGGRLRFNDIAVIVANVREFGTYCAHIASVFREMHGIPHAVADLSSGGSRVVEAARLLLALPQSGLTRSDLLGVLTHPACLARFPGADPEEWVRWCDELSICHGASSRDHEGTYIAKDLYNWDQGIRRLVLGVFLEGERSGEARTFAAAAGREYLPREVPRGSQASAGLLALLVRSLLADIGFLRSAELNLAEWSSFLGRFLTTYLGAETAEDEHMLSRCLGEVAALAKLDLEGRKVPYGIAREHCLAAIGSLTLARGQYLAEGVAVSSFLPMRPIPFRAVFIAGMGEGLFPAREMKSPLDLRNARRMAGDVSARERDQYNFLETLVSTRDRLTLSYVSRDGQTGEPLAPSSIIKELQYYVTRNCGPAAEALRSVKHPLRRYDAAYFPGLFGGAGPGLPNHSAAARSEARTVLLRQNLVRRLRGRGLPPDTTALERQCGGPLARLLHPVGIPSGPAPAAAETVRVPLYAVRKFLESPLQGWAGFHLGLQEEDYDDRIEINDEVFATERVHAVSLLRGAFLQALREPEPEAALGPACAAAMARNELRGISPTGVFQQSERARFAERMQGWWLNAGLANLRQVREWRTVRFGMADEHDAADERHPPLVLDIPAAGVPEGAAPLRVELYGTLEHLSADGRRTLALVDRSTGITQKDFLRCFLNHIVLSAAGSGGEQAREAHVLSTVSAGTSAGDLLKRHRTVLFPEVPGGSARSYLAGVIGDLLTGTHTYLLPIEAVVKHRWNNPSRKPVDEIIEELREAAAGERRRYGAAFSCLYGPVPEPTDHGPPSLGDAEAMIERRLGLFLASMPAEW